jgi:hypothetical protein
MLHVFSINRVKLMARIPTTTDIKRRREYMCKYHVILLFYFLYFKIYIQYSRSIHMMLYNIFCDIPIV